MTDTATTIFLQPKQFRERETPLLADREFTCSTFRYESGVCALRLKNSRGEIVMLPYQGQQIWSASFDGRDLTMISAGSQPVPSEGTVSTQNAFMLHCGATSWGFMQRDNSHPQQGELINAAYQRAELMVGMDQRGRYLAISGRYHHTMAYSYNYLAIPQVRIYAGAAVLEISMKITNLKKSPMPLVYQACISFRPAHNGRILTTSQPSPESQVLLPELSNDPDQLVNINYINAEDGWARSMQVHSDGTADLLRHRPDQLPHGLRWICRTPNVQVLGFEPATIESPNSTSSPGKDHQSSLEEGETFQCDLQVGLLTREETQQEIALVEQAISY